ncbi:hypothetical protein [Halopenitus persicus]|uniref:Uncharacterized protein n=1 Tax=Halopenitus persicus TaxID=1048396 RepID=A0A1H3G6K2_9EURY|nr:hypothetical protein [Halopenitus persicus]QHS16893.1 hypothetical protein GWK26_06905 [haloarchaeon 3A1-DGR]SDX97999.1 hypothetical protein SAMN05216564_102328 [Halopenitus persicus]
MVTTESLLFGAGRRRGLSLIGACGAVTAVTVLAVLALGSVAPSHHVTSFLADDALPSILLYLPAPIALVGAYARCGAPSCLAVGVVPGVVFGAIVVVGGLLGVPGTGADATVLGLSIGLSIGFSVVGLSSAFVGYCTGVTAVLALDAFREGGGRGAGE